jgi:3-oxoacyl-[acyl-carrier protein] reductase
VGKGDRLKTGVTPKGGVKMDFAGKVGLVTGGARGIGRATALALAKAGADVVVNDLQNPDAAPEVVALIQRLGRKCLYVRADIGNRPEVEALFKKVDSVFGRLDILINNAGVGGPLTPLEEVTDDFWNTIFQVNVAGVFLCTQAAARLMIPNKYGRIVNVSSIAAVQGMAMHPTYSAAKAAVLGFTKATARYLGKHNITVNAVSPGPTDTELSQDQLVWRQKLREETARAAALGRVGTPEGVADAILFFASDYSRHVTGQMILVDGGIAMP